MQVEINNIKKRYGAKQVLKGISFSAEGGTCIGILGSNGCGKSTLLSILAGVIKANEGSFSYDGDDLFRNSHKRAQLVGYVPQGTPLIEELNARDNLLLWYDKKEMLKELDSGVLKMLSIDEFLKTQVSKMSGGMKKRLSIGCAMAQRPPILLLDEPTAALDIVCKNKIAEYLKLYKKSGGLLLLATHDAMELALCDQCYIIKNGLLEPFEFDGDIGKLVESL